MTEEAMRVEIAGLKDDVSEIKQMVKETNQTVTQMRIEQAGLKVKVSLIASTVGAFVGAIVSAWIGKR